MKQRVLLMMIYTDQMNQYSEEPGICYIASVLRKNGYEVLLLAESSESLDYVLIQEYSPDVIGLTIYKTSEFEVLSAAKNIKKILPNTIICLGGYSVTYEYRKLMQNNDMIDFIIRGEGEYTFLNLLHAVENKDDFGKVKGIVYRSNNNIICNEMPSHIKNLDALPLMARDFLEQKKYKMAIISSSRGCSGNCSFCVTKSLYSGWRARSVKSVIDEVEFIHHKYDIHVFYFIDCSFENPGNNYKRVEALAREILDRGIKIHYFAFFRSDFQRNADPALMKLLKKSGLFCAILGIESADSKSLQIYNKSATVIDNEKAIALFKDAGIFVEMGFIMFNPYSDFNGLHINIDFLEKYKVACNIDYVLSRYSMYKGCTLNNKIIADGLAKCEGEIYEYRYLDERVNHLVSYQIRYFETIYQELGINMIEIHNNIVNFEYMKIIYSDHIVLCNLIENYKPVSNNMVNNINHRIAIWFRQLLNLAQSGWNEEGAKIISENILPRSYITDVYNKMEERKKIFYIKLKRAKIVLKNNPYIQNM